MGRGYDFRYTGPRIKSDEAVELETKPAIVSSMLWFISDGLSRFLCTEMLVQYRACCFAALLVSVVPYAIICCLKSRAVSMVHGANRFSVHDLL